jgi:hypothetical protein
MEERHGNFMPTSATAANGFSIESLLASNNASGARAAANTGGTTTAAALLGWPAPFSQAAAAAAAAAGLFGPLLTPPLNDFLPSAPSLSSSSNEALSQGESNLSQVLLSLSHRHQQQILAAAAAAAAAAANTPHQDLPTQPPQPQRQDEPDTTIHDQGEKLPLVMRVVKHTYVG